MRVIVLLCVSGMSTSMLVKKLRDEAASEGYSCEINAYPVLEAPNRCKEADIILLGPQIRFHYQNVKKQCPDKPVELIDMVAYGLMDAKKILSQVKTVLGDL